MTIMFLKIMHQSQGHLLEVRWFQLIITLQMVI